MGCNPYSEALFRTVKYVPTYPGCFESVQHARTYMETFTHWYNHTHYHSSISRTPRKASAAGIKLRDPGATA